MKFCIFFVFGDLKTLFGIKSYEPTHTLMHICSASQIRGGTKIFSGKAGATMGVGRFFSPICCRLWGVVP